MSNNIIKEGSMNYQDLKLNARQTTSQGRQRNHHHFGNEQSVIDCRAGVGN